MRIKVFPIIVFTIILLFLCQFVLSSIVLANQIFNIPILEDTMIGTSWNDGCGNGLLSKGAPSSIKLALAIRDGITEERILLRFDLTNIAPDTIINTAKLRLYMTEQSEYEDNYVNVNRLTEAWEGNYATWCARINSDSWSDIGGTYTIEGQTTVLIPSSPYEEWIEWDVTQIVKDWVENGKPNFGVIVYQINNNPSNRNQSVIFYTKDFELRKAILIYKFG